MTDTSPEAVEHTGLVRRLRDSCNCHPHNPCASQDECFDALEAADTIEAQAARIAALEEEVARLLEGATHLVPAVAELLKALDAYGAMDDFFPEVFPNAERRGIKASTGYKAVMSARANVQAWAAVTAAIQDKGEAP